MPDPQLARLDLNLLVVLDAVLEARSTTAAARRLGLTQSAVSHALGRLRDALGDPLLVRAVRGMTPTPRGLALQAPLRETLDELGALLRPPDFDPATANATFTIASADFASLLLLPALTDRLARSAPGVDLRVRPMPPDTPAALARGELDLAFDVRVPDVDGLHASPVLDEGFVVLLRADHPALTAPLDVAAYAALRHVQIAPGGRPGGPVDELLALHGLRRRVWVTVPTFLVAPHLIAGSDAALTVPARVAERIGRPLGLVQVPVPLPLGRFTLHQLWHRSRHRHAAHRWLRREVAEVLSDAADAGARHAPGDGAPPP